MVGLGVNTIGNNNEGPMGNSSVVSGKYL